MRRCALHPGPCTAGCRGYNTRASEPCVILLCLKQIAERLRVLCEKM